MGDLILCSSRVSPKMNGFPWWKWKTTNKQTSLRAGDPRPWKGPTAGRSWFLTLVGSLTWADVKWKLLSNWTQTGSLAVFQHIFQSYWWSFLNWSSQHCRELLEVAWRDGSRSEGGCCGPLSRGALFLFYFFRLCMFSAVQQHKIILEVQQVCSRQNTTRGLTSSHSKLCALYLKRKVKKVGKYLPGSFILTFKVHTFSTAFLWFVFLAFSSYSLLAKDV